MNSITQTNKESLINEFPHLILNEQDNPAITKKNLVAELKKNFPKFKFSVTKAHYDCYYIRWVNGVTATEVNNVVDKFIGWENDHSGDFRDFHPSDFNRVFGSFKYIFCSRTKCENFTKLKLILKEYTNHIQDFHSVDLENLFFYIFRNTSIPLNAVVTGIKRKENYSGSLNDAFYVTFKTNTN